jgi:hypothetical protein
MIVSLETGERSGMICVHWVTPDTSLDGDAEDGDAEPIRNWMLPWKFSRRLVDY